MGVLKSAKRRQNDHFFGKFASFGEVLGYLQILVRHMRAPINKWGVFEIFTLLFITPLPLRPLGTLHNLLPLVLGAQTQPIETDGGRVLAIMWPLLVHNMQRPTENRCRRSGGLWRGSANEVERVGMRLRHRFGRQIKQQK
jgi:hypothetical protein